ncbi:MAG TPA: hypothetical protein DCG57_04155 [Candidatus Riflebacteria bacterium]|nr:hypothetical protein [Candidatus Riflebacteria bacterium]
MPGLIAGITCWSVLAKTSENMKIAYFSSSSLPSQSANSVQVLKMCEAFAENGHQVELFARPGADLTDVEQLFDHYGCKPVFGINLVSAPAWQAIGGMLFGWRAVARLAQLNFKPDLIYGRNIYALIAAARDNTDIYFEAHAAPYSAGRRYLERMLFALPQFKRLIVINHALRDYYLKAHPQLAHSRKVSVLVAHDGASVPAGGYNRTQNASENKTIIGYAGGLYPGKGMERIIEIAAKMPDFEFRIAGGSPDEISYWVKRSQSDNVVFSGHLRHAEIAAFLEECDILLAPYQARVTTNPQGIGNISPWMSPLKIFEYMASRRPIIASRLPALEEILVHQQNALLVKPDRTDEWCLAIKSLADSRNLGKKLAEMAYSDLVAQYTWSARARLLLAPAPGSTSQKSGESFQGNSEVCEKIKCLHVIGDLAAGGAEKMLCRLINASDKNRFLHQVVTLMPPGELAADLAHSGIEIFSLNMNRLASALCALPRLIALIRRQKPDVIHTWMYYSDIIGGLAARAARATPVIFSIRHGGFVNDPWKTILSARLTAAIAQFIPTRIVACSSAAAEAHCRIGYPSERISIIPNGFDPVEENTTTEFAVELHQQLNIRDDQPLIGLIGRYHPAKDHENFIGAAATVARSFPEAHYVLCGKGITSANKRLATAIERAGLTGKIHLLGQLSDIAAIMKNLRFLVSSSISEAFPNVVGEAMSIGIPCVVTDVGDSAKLLGDTGIVVPAGNSAALAEGIISMLKMSRQELAATGARARARIEKNFSMATVAKQYEKLYLEVTNERQRK